VNAVIIGSARRSKKNGAATAEVEIELDGVRKLVEGWLELADALEDPQLLRTAWRELGPPSTGHGRPPLTTAQRRGPAEWDLHVSGAAAQEICAEGRPLTKPMGLAVQGEEAVVELVCRFFPCDNEARALFLRDEAIAQLLASERPARQYADVLRQAAAAIPAHGSLFAAKAVLDRIWRLGYYQLVYDLRERMDFAYE
jgi:hypothetical protein